MTETTPIAVRVRKLCAEQLGRTYDQCEPNAHMVNDLGADSLDAVEIVLSAEDDFDIEISDGEAEAIKTVGDIIALVERLSAG